MGTGYILRPSKRDSLLTIALQLSRLFHATAQIGTSGDTQETEGQDAGESSLEMSLNDILMNVLDGMDKIDPEKALELRREFQDPSSSSTQSRPVARPNLGTSSVHGQIIDPQGNILVVRQEIVMVTKPID
jgi:hypothetical protein